MNLTPPWIEITTVFPCANKCPYCPQDVLIKAYKGTNKLTLANFKKALSNIPKDVTIDFAGFSEPFLNKECADMMVYANEQGYKVAVNSTLVGFTAEDEAKIKDIPFVQFHFHDANKGKTALSWMNDTGKVTKPLSRAGNLKPEPRREEVGKCLRAANFNINVMLPNGDVVLCCNDYALQHKLGNLFKTNFNDLERLKEYELCHYCSDCINL